MCCGWYQVISGISWLFLGSFGWFGWLLGGFMWHQVVSASFRSFQAVPRFSKYGTSQCWHRFDVLIFVWRFTLILAFVQNFNNFDSQLLETVEWIFLYIYRGLYSHLYGSKSYILHVQKIQTSEMLDDWYPTSKLSDIKLSYIPDFICLYENPHVCHTCFWYL